MLKIHSSEARIGPVRSRLFWITNNENVKIKKSSKPHSLFWNIINKALITKITSIFSLISQPIIRINILDTQCYVNYKKKKKKKKI